MTNFSRAGLTSESKPTAWGIASSARSHQRNLGAPTYSKSSGDEKSTWWSIGIVVAALGMGTTGLVAAAKWRLLKASDSKSLTTNNIEAGKRIDFADSATGEPGKSGILYGIRVLDMSTSVGGASLGLIMAQLGAEVMKVEGSSGDPLRSFHLEREQGREFGTCFEAVNCGKYSVQLDLATKDGLDKLKILLKDADVLITNWTLEVMEALGLGFSQLAKIYPHLIFAQLTAWGNEGPNSRDPDIDIGAFWAATGLSGLLHDESKRAFSSLPHCTGELASAQIVLSGVMLALSQRHDTGFGRFVSSSLLHCGSWCANPFLLLEQQHQSQPAADPNKIIPLYTKEKPKADPVHTVYKTLDGYSVAVIGHQPSLYGGRSPRKDKHNLHEHAVLKLAKSLGINVSIPLNADEIYDCVTEKVSRLTYEEVSAALSSQHISHRHCQFLPALWATIDGPEGGVSIEEEATFKENLQFSPPGLSDLRFLLKLPYSFSSSESHGLKKRAPFFGENTRAIVEHGWFHRPDQWVLPKVETTAIASLDRETLNNLPMKGCTVVELVDFNSTHVDVSISAASKVLLEQGGCHVIRVEPKQGGGDPMRREHPELYEYLNSGKEILHIGDLSLEGNEQLQNLLSSRRTQILLTNFATSKLSHYAFDAKSLSVRIPDLILMQVEDYRNSISSLNDRSHGCLGAMWAASGLASCFSGKQRGDVPSPPQHVLELMASLYICAAVTIAWFHRKRTGCGQNASVFYDSIGHWSSMCNATWVHRNPKEAYNLFELIDSFYKANPHPACTSHRTKDGIWVQLLGSSLPSQLPNMLRAVGLSTFSFVKLGYRMVKEVLFAQKDGLRPLSQQCSLYQEVNTLIGESIGMLTYEELVKMKPGRYGLCVVPVRMPVQILSCIQARTNGVFETSSHGTAIRVTSPLRLSSLNLVSSI